MGTCLCTEHTAKCTSTYIGAPSGARGTDNKDPSVLGNVASSATRSHPTEPITFLVYQVMAPYTRHGTRRVLMTSRKEEEDLILRTVFFNASFCQVRLRSIRLQGNKITGGFLGT